MSIYLFMLMFFKLKPFVPVKILSYAYKNLHTKILILMIITGKLNRGDQDFSLVSLQNIVQQ